MVGLITPEEQEKAKEKILEYYRKLYPGVEFKSQEEELSHEQLGELMYTYSGEETEATAEEKMRIIASAIGEGYSTPIIVLRAQGRNLMLDGHRRVRVAYGQGMSWKAIVIIPSTDAVFGIEKMVMGKVKDLWGK
ncbi:TPA: hypothetical protein EYP38_00500 [Candidatus Micrarchaeota archaeon]|nr:hypothetical protein [Candidatus Micrarchaeota archaeon]